MSDAPLDDEAAVLALVTAFWHAPAGDKLSDPVFAQQLDEALADWPTVKDRMLGLLLLTLRLIDLADEDASELLAKVGLDLARELGPHAPPGR